MATADDIRTTIARYVAAVGAADADAIVDLYADDATVEDPVGTDAHVGRDAIHAFYKSVAVEGMNTEIVGKVNVIGLVAAFRFNVVVDGNTVVEPIDIMTFDDDAKITSMKAYWSFD